ncbi:TrmH family RNA methyltransferase [Flavobacterium sp.]|uniref:TrmH family RNA methyltransferase n=1 Tax=Flavobacterium sp. TaxID=239 RepID=UPI0039E2B414
MELIAVLENPNYIINIGHVIRNVNGLGVDKLYVVDGLKRLEADLEALRNRKSLLKHSSGAVQFTDIRRFDTSQDCFDSLQADGFVSVATSPHRVGKQHFVLHQSRLNQPKLAIWFGEEANGLSDLALERCEFCVTVPMAGGVESFNLATTTAIVLYEAVKQRRF